MLAVALAVAMLCGVCLNLCRESSHASSIVVPNLNTTAATAVYETKRASVCRTLLPALPPLTPSGRACRSRSTFPARLCIALGGVPLWHPVAGASAAVRQSAVRTVPLDNRGSRPRGSPTTHAVASTCSILLPAGCFRGPGRWLRCRRSLFGWRISGSSIVTTGSVV